MLKRIAQNDLLRDAAIVVVVTFAIQGLSFYVSEPLSLPSIAVVLAVLVVLRTLVGIQQARTSRNANPPASVG
jgi:hypothetical protein